MKLDIIASTTSNQTFYTQSILMFTFHMSYVSVGIAQYGLDTLGTGVRSLIKRQIFLFYVASRSALGFTKYPIQ
jgi:hypothetical protein